MAPTNSLRELAVDFVKLDRFDGGNFIRWQKKLHFLLSTLNVVYVLTTPKPVEHDDETMAQIRQRRKWEQDDYICKGHICNAMSDALFDQYHNVATAKEIWDSLEAKYMVEDATSKKFLASKFFDYKMVNSSSKVHMVEEGKEAKQVPQHFKNKKRKFDSKKNQSFKKKVSCHHCGKPGHFKRECRLLKKKKEENTSNFMAMISEINALEDDTAWWIDSGATRHVCKDRSLFTTYENVDDRNILYMGNSSTATIEGKGNVRIEFTSGKILTLTDVCHVPEVRKNLVSGSLLNKHGFKLVFESDNFVLTKGGVFVGKGYLYKGMFKLNLLIK
ncbi:hypothetical protein LWI29_029164 [Acer saccharum]|uniref:CCHC-type domain-containing protein n=1 Tax=Acer saccharum TaxID=4024 RepID=A0AA39SDK0_ACESA|nr:hypothetical protein LWI29_029164 [Acer saccharum]